MRLIAIMFFFRIDMQAGRDLGSERLFGALTRRGEGEGLASTRLGDATRATRFYGLV